MYPTVSDQKTPNANLTVDPQEVSIAQFQAAMFSRVCKVYAPMYRQLTLSNIGGAATPAQQALAYGDVRTAWSTYLHRYNHGRGIVLIGHSQGAFLLRRLITTQVDTSASARRLMVSAILLGGNVTVRNGSDVGGDFRHIRACHSATQTGCVLAWSTPPLLAMLSSAGRRHRACRCSAPIPPPWLEGPDSSIHCCRPARSPRARRLPRESHC